MVVKVGDIVKWCGGFGMFAAEDAVVEGMEITQIPRDKYGINASEVDASLVRQNRVLFTLDNGHWAYSDQIELIRGNHWGET
jgi:hypothetical protein